MSLHQQIQSDLTTAMKSRDRARTSALRMVVSELKNRAIEQGQGPQGQLDDETVQGILSKEAKRRREAAEAYREAGRADQAAAEDAECAVYEDYLPAQLDDDELTRLVDAAIAEVGAEDVKQMGQVMKVAMGRVAGQAEGARVSALVKQRLAG